MKKFNGLKKVDHFRQGKGRVKSNFFRIFVIIWSIFFASNTDVVFGVNLEFVEKLEILQEAPFETMAFCVTEDELFIIPDYKAGNIKVYEETYKNKKKFLTQVKIIGRKGYGPGELARPTFCSYNKNESKFVVLDRGIRKIFIYDRIGRTEFKQIKEIPCWQVVTDIQLNEERLFISGYTPDPKGKHYDLYFIDLTNNKTTLLLPSYIKYGLKSSRDFEIQFKEKFEIPAIGINAFFDIHRDNAYFVWEGNLKIIKLNILSEKNKQNCFGMQPHHYVKPYASPKLLEGRRTRDLKLYESERAKMSYVRNIFVSPKYILVVYEGPANKGNASNFRLQFYTLDGNFIRDLPIRGQPDWRMYFNKDENFLYSLSGKSHEDQKFYFILKYEILE